MERIGFIGLGKMGRPMANNLLKRGFPLTVFSRNKNSVSELVTQGAEPADSPRAVAQVVEIVLLSLPSPEVVREVVLGADGVIHGLKEGGVIIDTSTIDPSSAIELAASVEKRGLHLLDAPVSGGPEGAERATLTFMVGGDPDAFDRCSAVFGAMGKNVFYMGKTGSGDATKLVNQLLVSAHTLATAEAVLLAQALHLDLDKTIKVIETSAGDSFIFRRTSMKMATGDFGHGWQSYLLHKDLGLVLKTAATAELRLDSPSLVHGLFGEVLREGFGETDSACLFRTLQKKQMASH